MRYFRFSLVSNDFTNYGRRHFKLFPNCHVSWDVLWVRYSVLYVGQKDEEKKHENMIEIAIFTAIKMKSTLFARL